MSAVAQVKLQKRSIAAAHSAADDRKAFAQVIATLAPIGALWWAVAWSAGESYWLTAVATLALTLFLVRVFVLMHDCGHASLFNEDWLNRTFGFLFGVLSGMPQYVWSKHHAYHHATNGNWSKYRGPLVTASTEEYEALGEAGQRKYHRMRGMWLMPLHGFLYVLFFPRYTWLKGSLQLLAHLARGRPAAEFKTKYWTTPKEYWHMFWNNVVLLGFCAGMAAALGPALFFTVYLVSGSLAGAVGIVLFSVQHNYEHSYASGDEGWDIDAAAIHGTSFLVLPRWLNWFTADIAYHHVHHLSAAIPNYRLADCHREHAELFSEVTRITLWQIPAALRCNLWDTRARWIISEDEYEALKAAQSAPVSG
ncbi:MAG TPA: fatty acid desaturase [Burkholderiales bacterium]|nr:fatty acid desaturase [Burkholderiales bacterium]